MKLIKNIFLQTQYSRRRSVASGLKIPNLFRPGATNLHLTGLLHVDSIKIYFWRNRSGNCFRFLLHVFFVLKWQISPIYQKCLKKVDTFCNWQVFMEWFLHRKKQIETIYFLFYWRQTKYLTYPFLSLSESIVALSIYIIKDVGCLTHQDLNKKTNQQKIYYIRFKFSNQRWISHIIPFMFVASNNGN